MARSVTPSPTGTPSASWGCDMETAYFGADHGRSGISVRYTRRRLAISISGWYDGMVGIEGETLPLVDFLARIGVSTKDLMRIANELPRDGQKKLL